MQADRMMAPSFLVVKRICGPQTVSAEILEKRMSERTSLPESFFLRSLDELIAMGDDSVTVKLQTHGHEYYGSPTPYCDKVDLAIENNRFRDAFGTRRDVRTPARYVALLRDCYVLPNAAIVTNSGYIVVESCFPYFGREAIIRMFAPWIIAGPDISLRVDLASVESIETPTIYFREHGELGFFHWVHSVLPRADIIIDNKFNYQFGILCSRQVSFQKQSLAMCGLHNSLFITPNPDRAQKFSELLFVGPIVDRGDFWLRPLSTAKFYDRFSAPSVASPRRIYVNRRSASMRRLVNEDELCASLAKLGFESVDVERLSFAEQVGLFRSCEFVVGVHGAGLSHIVNLPQYAGVLEILHPRRFWPTYRALAARRGVRYGVAVGDHIDDNVEGDSVDFTISVDKVAAVLHSMRP